MSGEIEPNTPQNPRGGGSRDQGSGSYVMLPIAPEDFGQFISSLLGKPQTIGKSFRGVFEISRQDVLNTYELVRQRIQQQNEATLIQFSVRITYDDDSSVLLDSIEDFKTYNEVRPISSTGVVMSWSWLVTFRTKRAPEKQQIDLSFGVTGRAEYYFVEEGGFQVTSALARAYLRIQHTERTWGVDLESLLSGHIEKLKKEVGKVRQFVFKNHDLIGFLFGVLFLFGSVVGAYYASMRVAAAYVASAKSAGAHDDGPQALMQKMDFLIDIISSGVWQRFSMTAAGFLLLSLVLAVVFGGWVGTKAGNMPPTGYILLSAQSEERKRLQEKRLKRDWGLFVLSMSAGIFTGILSNWLFVRYFTTLPSGW